MAGSAGQHIHAPRPCGVGRRLLTHRRPACLRVCRRHRANSRRGDGERDSPARRPRGCCVWGCLLTRRQPAGNVIPRHDRAALEHPRLAGREAAGGTHRHRLVREVCSRRPHASLHSGRRHSPDLACGRRDRGARRDRRHEPGVWGRLRSRSRLVCDGRGRWHRPGLGSGNRLTPKRMRASAAGERRRFSWLRRHASDRLGRRPAAVLGHEDPDRGGEPPRTRRRNHVAHAGAGWFRRGNRIGRWHRPHLGSQPRRGAGCAAWRRGTRGGLHRRRRHARSRVGRRGHPARRRRHAAGALSLHGDQRPRQRPGILG